VTITKNRYNLHCGQLRDLSREAAVQLLEAKDRENPDWIKTLCKRPERRSWFSFSLFSLDDLVNGVCIAVLICLLISANATRMTVSAAGLFLTQEQSAETDSSASQLVFEEEHDEQ
jgi:Tfp pilus assembly protein PilN